MVMPMCAALLVLVTASGALGDFNVEQRCGEKACVLRKAQLVVMPIYVRHTWCW
jgi:hypothetical protein